MREIKFRGKCIKVYYGMDWAYGDLITTTDAYFNVEKAFIHNRLSSIECQYPMHSIVHINEIDPKTVGQYTGLKDKNGKEIYEGDFFKDIADGYLWQVFYDEGCYYASSGPDTLMLQELLMKSGKCDVEVVGNIYENPELLEM